MKKPPFLLLCFLMAVCGDTFAQVVEQPGRTRKIAYSKHAAIEPVADVLIEVQTEERSDGDGRFVLKIDGKNTFVYKHIYKTGYTLISPSPDELWREQALNPAVELDIVLVRTREWADEKMRIERNIRQAMESQIAEKEAELDRKEKELERLRADDADYARICGERDSLRLVTRDYYRKYGESDRFISDAADELARIDYRDLDSIELTNVEFRKQGKGREMVAFNRSLLPANEAEIVRTLAANIDAKRKELDKALAMRDQLARRYKDIADGFALQYQNDSAAFYLHRRIEIDPENWEYNREYGRFIRDYLATYDAAISVFSNFINKLSTSVIFDIEQQKHNKADCALFV